jgi:hypothetical protein
MAAMKTAIIRDQDDDSFVLEYDNNVGKKHTMRLDAATYERAVREAKSFLGINQDNVDADGTVWAID